MKSVWVDANVIVRLMTNDPPEQAGRAVRLFRRAERGDLVLVVPVVVIAEVIWALRSFYRYPLSEITTGIQALVSADGVVVEGSEAILEALNLMVDRNVDFADAYLAAIAIDRDEEVASFDDDLRRLGARTIAI